MIVSGESINGYSGGYTQLFSEISVKWSSQGGLRLFFLNLRGNTCIVCVVVLVSELSENRPISSLYASAFKARFNKDENIS